VVVVAFKGFQRLHGTLRKLSEVDAVGELVVHDLRQPVLEFLSEQVVDPLRGLLQAPRQLL
jgi:hypothetical protein